MDFVEKTEKGSMYQCKKCNSTSTLVPPNTNKKKTKKSKVLIRDRGGEIHKENTEVGRLIRNVQKEKAKQRAQEEKTKQKTEVKEPKKFNNRIKAIKESMNNKKLLQFTYIDKNGNKSARVIEPYKIEKDGKGNIVLWGYCTEKEGIRRFVLKNISKMSESTYEFDPRWDIEFKLK
jgi:predicted DNA-binding transcriptional regulator YafY